MSEMLSQIPPNRYDRHWIVRLSNINVKVLRISFDCGTISGNEHLKLTHPEAK
jgi:hypothetical protein